MFGLSRLYIYVGSAVLAAGVAWAVYNGIGDAREDKLRLEGLTNDLEDIREDKESDDEIDRTNLDDVIDFLGGWVPTGRGD